MDELLILVARLGWPSTSARWWTMQQLAARLVDPATRIETESALLQLLSTRKLEAEAVEILCIFWMAVQSCYLPGPELVESISKPSLLSSLFVESCGLSIQVGNTDLQEVPEKFEIPDDFNGVQGVDLPRMFRTSMEKLETHSGLPFIRQMAFEWTQNRAAYPDAPYQGDPWHFTRPLGDGFIGQLSARGALRAISAYLRTLAVARQFWGMPLKLVHENLLLALPIHPTLALLRPHRPDCFPELTGFDCDPDAIEATIRALISQVGTKRPGDELIAFSSPVMISMERCLEVSVVRWSQVANNDMEEAELATHLESAGRTRQQLFSVCTAPLSTTTFIVPPTLEMLIDSDCMAWPLAGALDFERLGYLQHDLYPSRLFFPSVPNVDEIEVVPNNGQLDVKVEGQVVADFSYWNVGWGAARPRQLQGNCGTALISHGTTYRESATQNNESLRAFYFWQVRRLDRDNSFNEFSETLLTGVIFI